MHVDGDRYRAELVRPRLAKDRRLAREIGLDLPPQWMNANGILQPVHPIHVKADVLRQLNEYVARGLYYFHFGAPLSRDFYAEAAMKHPHDEAAFWDGFYAVFPTEAERVDVNLGRGAFMYSGVRSPRAPSFSAWRMLWHGGIPLHGYGAPPQGVNAWVVVTRPTPEAIARAQVGAVA